MAEKKKLKEHRFTEKKTGKKEEKKKEEQITATEIINERQETMFDTELSKLCDAFIKSDMEKTAWTKKRQADAKALIEKMKELNVKTLTMAQNRRIEYKHVDAKETVAIKEFKPSKKRRKF